MVKLSNFLKKLRVDSNLVNNLRQRDSSRGQSIYVEQWLTLSKLKCKISWCQGRGDPSFPTHWAGSHRQPTALNVCVWLRLLSQRCSHWIVKITAFCMQPASFSHSLLFISPFILSLEWYGFPSHIMKPQDSIIWWQLREKCRSHINPHTYSIK